MKILKHKRTTTFISVEFTDAETSRLLPCPFCGGPASLVSDTSSYGSDIRIGIGCISCDGPLDPIFLSSARRSAFATVNKGKNLRLSKELDRLTVHWNTRAKQ